MASGLVASLLAGLPARAESTPSPGTERELVGRPAVMDEVSAVAQAQLTGERVEVLAERTEFSQTFATPRGTLVVDEYVRPQWVRSPDGGWVEVDPSLRRAPDGSWEPAAAIAEMRFSGGGAESALAEIRADGVSVGLAWPEELPEPVVEGNVATYRDVAPFVDLRVVADVEGFTHLVVIRSPKALEDPRVQQIALSTDLSGVSLRVANGGAVEAVDESGTVVFTGPSPMMWDSRDTAGAAPPVEEKTPGQHGAGDAATLADPQPRSEPLPVDVSAGKLTLTPDMGMLSDPETVYPVYVDPTWIKVTGKRNKWSLLRKSFPNSSFYNPAVGSTASDDATKGIVRAGYVVWDRVYTDRSIFNMSTSAVKNKRVNKATFSLTQSWSWYNCGHSSPPTVRLRTVGSFSSSTT